MIERREFLRLLACGLPAAALAGAFAPALASAGARMVTGATLFEDDLGRKVEFPARLGTGSVGLMDLPAEQLLLATAPDAACALVSAQGSGGRRSDLLPESARGLETRAFSLSEATLDFLAGDDSPRPQLIVGTFSPQLGAGTVRGLEADIIQRLTGVPVLCLSSAAEDAPHALRALGELLDAREKAGIAARQCEQALRETDAFLASSEYKQAEHVQVLCLGEESAQMRAASFLAQMGGIAALARSGAENAAPEPELRKPRLREAEQQASQLADAARDGGIEDFQAARDDIYDAFELVWNDDAASVAPAGFTAGSIGTIAIAGNETISPARILVAGAQPVYAKSSFPEVPVTGVPSEPYPWLTGGGSLMDLLGAQWAASVLYPDICPWSTEDLHPDFFDAEK